MAAGLGLVMEMTEHERLWVERGCPRMRQFQWWRMCKACQMPSPDLRQYQVNELFMRCQEVSRTIIAGIWVAFFQ